MNTISKFVFLSTALLFIHCKKENETPKVIEAPKVIAKPAVIKKTKDTLKTTTEDIDPDFTVFFELFNKDTVFQISRIEFPLKVKVLNSDDFEIENIVISESNYSAISLNTQSENKEYTVKPIWSKTTAKIEIRGINNGIMKDLFFEKSKGKWKLITWTDEST